jgi:hypothetical protein
MSRLARFSSLLVGIRLGASVLIIAVVAYSFPGIDAALEANPELARRAGFDPKDEGARKTSTLWVYTGEQNRAYFRAWNQAQLVLGALTFLSALAASRSKGLALSLLGALAIAGVLAFFLGPEITSRGRALDFMPRSPPPPGLEGFQRLHQTYTVLEAAKVLCLAAAGFFSLRARGWQEV